MSSTPMGPLGSCGVDDAGINENIDIGGGAAGYGCGGCRVGGMLIAQPFLDEISGDARMWSSQSCASPQCCVSQECSGMWSQGDVGVRHGAQEDSGTSDDVGVRCAPVCKSGIGGHTRG